MGEEEQIASRSWTPCLSLFSFPNVLCSCTPCWSQWSQFSSCYSAEHVTGPLNFLRRSMSSSRKIQQCWHFKEIAWKENAKETYEVHTAISRGRIKTTSNHVKFMVEKMNIHEHQLFLGCVQQGTRVLTTQIIQILDWYPNFLNISLRIETHESWNYDGEIRRHPDHPQQTWRHGKFRSSRIFLGISQRHVYWSPHCWWLNPC